jgi:hypothetical protein
LVCTCAFSDRAIFFVSKYQQIRLIRLSSVRSVLSVVIL